EAWQRLAAIAAPRSAAQAARYHELQARAALAAGPPGGPAGAAPEEVGPHIALLLPITGRAAAAAVSVRYGFMTAYYQTPTAERPRVRVYDTGTHSVADALAQASQQGADFIVGPLTREEVAAAAAFSAPRAPLLALNFLPAEQPAPAQFYQYALSPEDEARLAARRILDDHHRRGVALVPAGDWGERGLDAFEPDVRANEELDGLMFPDMPWMLGGDLADAVHAATREAWPSGGPQRGRLFAFGFDAFRLAQALRRRGAPGDVSLAGLTGRL